MLHVLLVIIKVIGIIILSIIGLLLFGLLLIIFTPLRYEVEGKCTGDIDSLKLNARFSFLLRLFQFTIQYKEKESSWQARIAWKQIGSAKETASSSEQAEPEHTIPAKETPSKSPDKSPALVESSQKETVAAAPKSESSEATDVSKTESSEKTEVSKKVEHSEKASQSKKTEQAKKTSQPKKTEQSKKAKQSETNTKVQEDKKSFSEKIDAVIDKIKCTIQKICDKINQIEEIKETAILFIEDEDHKIAFTRLLSELKRLSKKLKPKRLKSNIRFGFENPSLTGKLLAGVSMIYPYIKDNIQLTADFEEKIFDGDIYIKGKLRISTILSFALRLIINKSVRITITHITKLVKKGGK